MMTEKDIEENNGQNKQKEPIKDKFVRWGKQHKKAIICIASGTVVAASIYTLKKMGVISERDTDVEAAISNAFSDFCSDKTAEKESNIEADEERGIGYICKSDAEENYPDLIISLREIDVDGHFRHLPEGQKVSERKKQEIIDMGITDMDDDCTYVDPYKRNIAVA